MTCSCDAVRDDGNCPHYSGNHRLSCDCNECLYRSTKRPTRLYARVELTVQMDVECLPDEQERLLSEAVERLRAGISASQSKQDELGFAASGPVKITLPEPWALSPYEIEIDDSEAIDHDCITPPTVRQ